MRPVSIDERFHRFAMHAAVLAGKPLSFVMALGIVVVWALSGPSFDYSPGWQLVINTGTTIITFLMVFVIQNTQTRESRELHVKLDELLRAVDAARDDLIDVESMSEEELAQLERELRAYARGEASAQRVKVYRRRDAVESVAPCER